MNAPPRVAVRSRCFAAVLLAAAIAGAQDKPRTLPAFDHQLAGRDGTATTIAASYVVTLPDGYTKERAWPLILDFHGAIAPNQKGAEVTRTRLWSKATAQVPAIVVGINGRTRAWGTIKGELDDVTFAREVLRQVLAEHNVDKSRIYLAGFSSGSDFLCQGQLQETGLFVASMPVCPGPPSVVGLRDGILLKKKERPFYFVTGEEDYIRKDGPWQAFLALDAAGASTMYREVPRVAHAFASPEEYARLFRYLELLAHPPAKVDHLAIAKAALQQEDFLLASTHLLRDGSEPAKAMLATIEKQGTALAGQAAAIDGKAEAGRAFEAWWRVRTQFHRFPELAKQAQEQLDALQKAGSRELGLSRRDFFRNRAGAAAPGKAAEPAGKEEGKAGKAAEPAPAAGTGKTAAAVPAALPPARAKGALWTFDRYLDDEDLYAHLKDLADRFPERARLMSIGKSVQGRDLWVLEICDRSNGAPESKPAAFIQACLHGNEVNALTTVLQFANQCVANPEKKRGVDRLMVNTTVYVLPAANPDAVHHFFASPHSYWRPRFNFKPVDDDGDGKADEDGHEDLDGDGEIGLMYRKDPAGEYVVRDGKMVRGKPTGPGDATYFFVGREGRDDDGDGKYGEDAPGGVDLNRNFPQGFTVHRSLGGFSGDKALCEPETAAIAAFVESHPEIGLFLDYHNDAKCVFFWHDTQDAADLPLMADAAARAEKALGYPPKPLAHVGAGLAVSWAYGHLGVPALLVELESFKGDNEDQYLNEVWKDAWMPLRAFQHPQLGEVLIGNEWKKLQKRNPAPQDMVWQGTRNADWLRTELARLPRIELRDLRVEPSADGVTVSGLVANKGQMPTDTARALRIGKAGKIRIEAEGAKVLGEQELGSLAPAATVPFRVKLTELGDFATLIVKHPRAGTVRYKVARPRRDTVPLRSEYAIEAGWLTPDKAVPADNAAFPKGVATADKGTVFPLKHKGDKLRLAVVLGEWSDQRHTHPPAEFAKAMFSKEEYRGVSPTGGQVYGSLADFYREMSHGECRVTGEVFGWYELPGKYAEYRDASFGSSIVQDKLLEALAKARGPDALKDFDGVAFVWAGNSVNRVSALWPMRLTLKQAEDKAAFKMGELHQGEFLPIGVPCHELAHTFGINDKYGGGASTNPFGCYCLMARGTHGGEPSARHRPFPMCVWCRSVIGWAKPKVIDPAVEQKLALRPFLTGAGEYFRILLAPDGSDYLLLENRRREGFGTDLPSAGLFIVHVGPHTVQIAPQKSANLLPAHGLRARAQDPVRPDAVAWPQPGHDSVTVGNCRISGIRITDDVAYFTVGPAGK